MCGHVASDVISGQTTLHTNLRRMYFLEKLLPQSEHGCLPDAETEPELRGNAFCKDKHTQFDKQTTTF